MTNSTIVDLMQSRKSVRSFDPHKKIPRDLLMSIFKAATTAPSSWNLQHWRFIILEQQGSKEKLYPIAWNQEQVLDSSCVIIVLGDLEAYRKGSTIFSKQVELGYMPQTLMDTYLRLLPHKYEDRDFAMQDAIRNASLAAMQLMLAAKSYGIDSSPMIGFKTQELMDTFEIPERYVPVMLVALGYGNREAHSTIRLPLEEVIYFESLK